MSNPIYFKNDFNSCLGHAIEECGEFLAAAGKLQRHGAESYDPTVSVDKRESNMDWMKREMRDVREAMLRLERAIGADY